MTDFWMFNLTSGWWTWLKRSNTYAFYGTQNVATIDNYPGYRGDGTLIFDKFTSSLYLFAGNAYVPELGGSFGKQLLCD